MLTDTVNAIGKCVLCSGVGAYLNENDECESHVQSEFLNEFDVISGIYSCKQTFYEILSTESAQKDSCNKCTGPGAHWNVEAGTDPTTLANTCYCKDKFNAEDLAVADLVLNSSLKW